MFAGCLFIVPGVAFANQIYRFAAICCSKEFGLMLILYGLMYRSVCTSTNCRPIASYWELTNKTRADSFR